MWDFSSSLVGHHLIESSKLILHFSELNMDTFLKSFPCRFPFFSPHCSLPHVLKNVTCIVIESFHELKGFIIFKYFFAEISSKVVFCAIAMKFIDDFDLIVKIFDIFSSLMSWNFDVNVSIYDEF